MPVITVCSQSDFSIAHWSLHSIATHGFIKLTQLEAYNAIHSYDLIYLSKHD